MKQFNRWLSESIDGRAIVYFRTFLCIALSFIYFKRGILQFILNTTESDVFISWPMLAFIPMPAYSLFFILYFLLAGLFFWVAISRKALMPLTLLFLTYSYYFSLILHGYNNHYYLTMLLLGLLLFSEYFYPQTVTKPQKVPRWNIMFLRWQWCIVYLYGGLAKLYSDWWNGIVLERTLLGATQHSLFSFLSHSYVVSFLSISGFFTDLFLSFGLLFSKTRRLALLCLILFHGLNQVIIFSDITGDSVGYFPLMGLISVILFVEKKDLGFLQIIQKKWQVFIESQQFLFFSKRHINIGVGGVAIVFIVIQIYLPSRRFIEDENVYWTGRHQQFSYLRNSSIREGQLSVIAIDPTSKLSWNLKISNYTDPLNFVLFAKYPKSTIVLANQIKKSFMNTGYPDVKLYFNSSFSLNGNAPQQYFNPNKDFARIPFFTTDNTWILKQTIK